MLKNRKYYNLVKKQLEKDKILENFEKINGGNYKCNGNRCNKSSKKFKV
ncbi:hypothetical protein [Anaerococcus obesiensis]|nr:hypothetical protein [Anaerococcus obesiensis]